jgi:hypothetical protein
LRLQLDDAKARDRVEVAVPGEKIGVVGDRGGRDPSVLNAERDARTS